MAAKLPGGKNNPVRTTIRREQKRAKIMTPKGAKHQDERLMNAQAKALLTGKGIQGMRKASGKEAIKRVGEYRSAQKRRVKRGDFLKKK